MFHRPDSLTGGPGAAQSNICVNPIKYLYNNLNNLELVSTEAQLVQAEMFSKQFPKVVSTISPRTHLQVGSSSKTRFGPKWGQLSKKRAKKAAAADFPKRCFWAARRHANQVASWGKRSRAHWTILSGGEEPQK